MVYISNYTGSPPFYILLNFIQFYLSDLSLMPRLKRVVNTKYTDIPNVVTIFLYLSHFLLYAFAIFLHFLYVFYLFHIHLYTICNKITSFLFLLVLNDRNKKLLVSFYFNFYRFFLPYNIRNIPTYKIALNI